MSGPGADEPGPDAFTDRPSGLLRVDADLEIDVDGNTGWLTAEGDRLVLTSAHPERLWAAATTSALPSGLGSVDGPKAIGVLADELARAGLRLDVTGPRGDVARLGKGVRSRFGQVLTGSAAVGPGAPGALAALAWTRIPTRIPLPLAAAVGAATLAAGALWLGFRRIRS